MSFANVKQKLIEQREPEAQASNRCWASGCPGRGSVSVEGGKFCCSNHAFAPSHRWPAITSAMQENSWLMEFLKDIYSMHEQHKDWRWFAVQFWESQGDENALCLPDPREEFSAYDLRMRKELAWRRGERTRPVARIPVMPKRIGNLGALLGAR